MKIYRKLLTILSLALILAACAPAATPTIPPTATVVPPTATPEPTLTPTPAPSTSRIIWEVDYGQNANDVGESVLLAEDGGFYIVGTANPDLEGNGENSDIYLIRTDANGNSVWERNLGGDLAEQGLSIIQTADGNLVIAGTAISPDQGGMDAYLIKVDPNGNEIWSKTLGGERDEMVSAIEMPDGGLMLWGNSVDLNDIVADPGAAGYGGFAGRSNIYLARTDADGNVAWAKTFGAETNLIASGGISTPDGGFMVLASLLTFPEPGDDLYLLRVDADGNFVWRQTWTDGTMGAYGLIGTADGNYVIAGSYISAETGAESKADFLFIKVDPQGNELWSSTFGNPDMVDYPQTVAETADGTLIAAGEWVRDWSGNYPPAIALVKLNSEGELLWQEQIDNDSDHNMLRAILPNADGSCMILGSRMKQQAFDVFLMKVDTTDPQD